MIQDKGNALLPQINAVTLEIQVPYDNKVPTKVNTIPSEPQI